MRMSEFVQDGVSTYIQSSDFSIVSKKGKRDWNITNLSFKQLQYDGYAVIEFHTDSISIDNYSVKVLFGLIENYDTGLLLSQ